MGRKSPGSVVLRVLVAALISVVLIYALATKIDWSQLGSMLLHVHIDLVLLACVALFAANMLRAHRFHLLDSQQHSYLHWWITSQIYNFLTSTLPGGVGEFATAYTLRKSSRGGWGGSLRLLVVARFFDLATLMALLLAALVGLELTWTSTFGFVASLASAGLCALSVAALLPSTQRAILRLIGSVFPRRWKATARLTTLMQTLSDASHYGGTWAALRVAAESYLLALLSCVSLLLFLGSFEIPVGFLDGIACYGLYVLLQLVPIQGFAGVGTQNARWTIALLVVGFTSGQATVLGVALYAVFYGAVAIFAALAGLIWLAVGQRPASAPTQRDEGWGQDERGRVHYWPPQRSVPGLAGSPAASAQDTPATP